MAMILTSHEVERKIVINPDHFVCAVEQPPDSGAASKVFLIGGITFQVQESVQEVDLIFEISIAPLEDQPDEQEKPDLH